MPFTLAHPAAIIPLARAWPRTLVPSALVIGSSVPDVEYFLRLQLTSVWSHTLPGLLTFCLPVGLLLLWTYHHLQKPALLRLLPPPLQQRLVSWSGPCPFWPAPRLAQLCFSLLLGASTHLLWDSLTHPNGLLVHWAALLAAPIVTILGIPISGFRLLQDGSTVGGLLLLVCWAYVALRNAPPAARPSVPVLSAPQRTLYVVIIAVIGGVLAWGLSFYLQEALSTNPVRRLLQQIVVCGIPALYLVITLYGLVMRLQHRYKHNRSERDMFFADE